MAAPRTFCRTALGATVLGLVMIAPATGTADTEFAGATSAVQGHGGSPTSAVDHVADFYGAYTDALQDVGHGPLTDALRRHYLTAELRHTLTRWEAVHHRDGILRAKGVPTRWTVAYNDSGMGHCWTRVALTWHDTGKQHTTHLMIQSDLATRMISDIRSEG